MKNLLLFLAFSFSAIAAPSIRNPQLSKIVAKAEALSAKKEHIAAAETYLAVLALKNPEAQKELEEIKEPFDYPYSLTLHYERLNCLQKARKQRTEAFKVECEKVLEKFNDQAEGKNWFVYIMVHNHLLCHYRINKNKEMIIKTLKEGAERWPLSHFAGQYIDYLVLISPELVLTNTIVVIERILQKHKEANNNKISYGMALCKLRLLKKNGDNLFNAALNYLKKYPNSPFEGLKIAITYARDAINPEKPEQIKRYHRALTAVGIKQPSDKAHMPTIAFIVNEKKKIETIMPEVKR